MNIAAWCGFAVPEDTPDAVYNYLVDIFTTATTDEGFQQNLIDMGTVPVAINGADAQQYMLDDAARYAEQLKDAQ